MQILEVRRHTMRRKPGQHLSKEGIDLANQVGNVIDPFSFVATSTIPRAIETAIAMGFEVDETSESLGHVPNSVFDEFCWPNSFNQISKIMRSEGHCFEFAQNLACVWRDIVSAQNDRNVLIISHGILVELGVIACVPNEDCSNWGEAIGYCEGVQLMFDGNRFVEGKILRLPKDQRIIEN